MSKHPRRPTQQSGNILNKILVTTIFLAMVVPPAMAGQTNVDAPLRHATFSYDDIAWEGRTRTGEQPNYSLRLHDSGVVFGINEEKTPHGNPTADELLAGIEDNLRQDFEMRPSQGLAQVKTPQGWSCRSFEMILHGSNKHTLSRTCVKAGSGVYERMTIIAPSDTISGQSVEALNAVISSLKDV